MGRKGEVNQRRAGRTGKYDQSMFYGTVKELTTIMVVNLFLKFIQFYILHTHTHTYNMQQTFLMKQPKLLRKKQTSTLSLIQHLRYGSSCHLWYMFLPTIYNINLQISYFLHVAIVGTFNFAFSSISTNRVCIALGETHSLGDVWTHGEFKGISLLFCVLSCFHIDVYF